jgi:phosphinothricin acetyltransferase
MEREKLAMGDLLRVRSAVRSDLPRLTEIYNHYITHTAVTFDVELYTVEGRARWFGQFAEDGRYRLMVAEENGEVVGYAGTTPFRPKAAYDVTVETTIYCAPTVTGKGVGARLYRALFTAIEGEDIRSIVAGFTLPNPGSARLHERFGFRTVGTFLENGRKFGRYWDVCWTQRPLRVSDND